MLRSRTGFAAAGACLLAGCTSTAVESNKALNYTAQPTRIAVVETIGANLPADFGPSFARMIQACHVDIATLTLPRRAEASGPALTAAFVAAHKSDAVLTIDPTTLRLAPGEVDVGYLLSLTDVASSRPVWKASVTLSRDALFADTSKLGQTLANSIIQRMQKDQLVANCAGLA